MENTKWNGSLDDRHNKVIHAVYDLVEKAQESSIAMIEKWAGFSPHQELANLVHSGYIYLHDKDRFYVSDGGISAMSCFNLLAREASVKDNLRRLREVLLDGYAQIDGGHVCRGLEDIQRAISNLDKIIGDKQ